MLYPSLFDSFFAPTRVIVVSEERLQQAEQEARRNQLAVLDNRIEELNKYRNSLSAIIKKMEPEPMTIERGAKVGADLDSMDGGTHDG